MGKMKVITAEDHHKQITEMIERNLELANRGMERYKKKKINSELDKRVNQNMISYIEGQIQAIEDILETMKIMGERIND